ncbi:hypothetical protein [Flavobacterium sp. HNIBRBA15423]|uniref:hypothetical protein n=1 Tax=Flavobacterium sp. HNIBRBA15423 TaxID=3458683 RepID=UPI004043C9E0
MKVKVRKQMYFPDKFNPYVHACYCPFYNLVSNYVDFEAEKIYRQCVGVWKPKLKSKSNEKK